MDKKKFFEDSINKGNLGEEFIKFWCTSTNQTYKKELTEKNYIDGIDAYIEGVPSDIKNTNKIYLGNYTSCFLTRHPFRENTKAVNYCIVEIDESKTSFKIKYNGSIKEYLEDNYITSYDKIKEILVKYERKTLSEIGVTKEQFFYMLKKEITPLLLKRVKCEYFTDNDGVIYLREFF